MERIHPKEDETIEDKNNVFTLDVGNSQGLSGSPLMVLEKLKFIEQQHVKQETETIDNTPLVDMLSQKSPGTVTRDLGATSSIRKILSADNLEQETLPIEIHDS